MRRALLVVALSAMVIGSAACRSAPAQHFYVLTLPGAPMAAGSSDEDAVRLGIAPFSIDSPYDGDQLIYRVGRDSPEIAFYALHRWAAPLRDQLALAATKAYHDLPGVTSMAPTELGRGSGGSGGSGGYDGVLVGRLLYLEELDVPAEQTARVGLELSLFDHHDRQVWFQAVSAQVSGQATEVPDIVRFMSEALQKAFGQARPGLAAAVAELTN